MTITTRVSVMAALLAPLAAAQQPQLGPAPRIEKTRAATAPRLTTAPQAAGGWVDITDREAVRQLFMTGYLPFQNIPLGWTGNLAAGNAGDTSAAYKNAVIALVNFFRSLAGVPPVITLDPVTTPKAQLAALMFAANNNLSHTPPTDWIDYTADGAEAAGKSNICVDTQLPSRPGCIGIYMEDNGDTNAAVGHRRWIVHPQTTRMGTGDIPPGDQAHPYGANDLWVINVDEVFAARPATRQEFVTWPPPGFVPQQFVFSRWSFAYHDADLSGATVAMTRNGATIPVHLEQVKNGFGENTLVWEPTTVAAPPAVSVGDVTTHVVVSNVIINGAPQQFAYDVTAFDPTQPTVNTRTISHIANGSGFRTTIILVNTGTQPANFDLKFWDDSGNPLTLNLGADGNTADLSGSINPGVSRFIRTTGVGANLQKGWAELTAPNGVDGNSIFGLQSPGQGDSEAAVPLSPVGGTELFLPFDNTTPYVTGIALAVPGQQSATVSGSFRDDSGQAIADSGKVNVAARGHNSDVLANYFPNTQQKRGAAHFTSNTSIFGLGIRSNGKAFTSIEGLSGVTAVAKTIPHIAYGDGWNTTFLLVNTGTQAANFTLAFSDDNGNPLVLPLGADGTVGSLTGAIPAGGLRIVQTQGGASLITGWATLSVTGAISGTAIFANQPAGQLASEAAVPFSTAGSTQLFMPYDYSPGYSTGIAFTNPNGTAATLTVSFVDDAGNNLGSAQVIVPAHGHESVVLATLLPGVAGTRGTVSLTSNVPVFGLGIRANGQAFTSLKVIAK
jgi:hypothetical protein